MAAHDTNPGAPARRRPSRRAMTFVSVPLVFLVVISYIGDAVAPSLVDTHPAWLIALNARNRNLVLVSNSLDAWSFYAIGTVRLLISDPLFFLLGFWYGDAAVRWMERRTRTWGQMLREFEGWFGKLAYPLVFIAPNNVICLFAGAAGMPLRAFFAVNLAGTVFRLWMIRQVGEAFDGPIDGIVGWIGDNRVPLLFVTVGLVLVSIALEARRGETEVLALVHMDDEIDKPDDESTTGRGAATDDGSTTDRDITTGGDGAGDTHDDPATGPAPAPGDRRDG